MSDSKLPWYGWLIAALALFIAGILGIRGEHGDFDNNVILTTITLVEWFFSVVFGLVGLIRLVKWAWKD